MKRLKIEVRATQELLNKLAKLAKDSKRTESDYLRQLIEYAFENNIKL